MTNQLLQEFDSLPISQGLLSTLARASGYAVEQSHLQTSLEHLLLALMEDADAGRILAVSDLNLDQLRTEVSAHLGLIEERAQPGSETPPTFSDDIHRVLKGAAAATKGRRREITGAIVLAAVVGDAKSPAAHLLGAQGLTFQAAIAALQAEPPEASNAAPKSDGDRSPEASRSTEADPSAAKQQPQGRDPNEVIAAARAKVQQRQLSSLSAEKGLAPNSQSADKQPAGLPPATQPAVTKPSSPHPAVAQEAAMRRAAAPPPDVPPHASPTAQAQSVEPPQSGYGEQQLTRDTAPATDLAPTIGAAHSPAHNPSPQDSMPTGPGARAGYRMPPIQPTMDANPISPRPRPLQAARSAVGQGPQRAPASERQLAPPPSANPSAQLPTFLEQALPQQAGAPQTAPTPAHEQQSRAQDKRADPRTDTRAEPRADLRPAILPTGPTTPPNASPNQQWAYPTPQQFPAHAPIAAANAAHKHEPPLPSLPTSPAEPIDTQILAEALDVKLKNGRTNRIELSIPRNQLLGFESGRNTLPGIQSVPGLGQVNAVSIRLRAPKGGAFIEPMSAETQWLDLEPRNQPKDTITWRWNITPRSSGKQPLQFKLRHRSVGPDGRALETALDGPVKEARVGRRWLSGLMKLLGYTVAIALGAGVVLTADIWRPVIERFLV
ncbi:MAG: Clp protease N-terminal domain-containing protein [Pseudomonadota bacterium]